MQQNHTGCRLLFVASDKWNAELWKAKQVNISVIHSTDCVYSTQHKQQTNTQEVVVQLSHDHN